MAKAKRRSDGRYGAKVTIGKNQYKYVCANSQKELDEKILQLKLKLGKGLDIAAERDTFGEWGKLWLKKKKSRVSENWHKALVINYKKLSELYDMPVTKLRTIDLERILDDIAAEKYSARVIKAVRDIANGIMQMCVENRVIEHNPFSAAEKPKASPRTVNERRALTENEQRWIRETPHRAQLPAMIMMYAGLRRGELLALQWSDIDLEARTISVTKSVVMNNGRPEVKQGGKTDSAERTVYIPQRLADYLRAQPRTSFYVVTDTKGRPMTDSAWRRLWDSYIKDLNCKYGYSKPMNKNRPGGIPIVIPHFTAHWLRHTFITLMYLSGVDVLTAAQQAGHSDIKVTMEIYTHLSAEYKQKNIDKLDAFLA